MAYVIDTNIDVPSENPIPLGIKAIFGGTGIFTVNYTSTQQARDNFRNLLLTRKGERLYHPEFGCDLLNILFQPMTDYLISDINNIIRTAVSYWLPYLTIENLDIKINSSEIIPNHTVKITIQFSVFGSIETNTIVIFAGENGILRID